MQAFISKFKRKENEHTETPTTTKKEHSAELYILYESGSVNAIHIYVFIAN